MPPTPAASAGPSSPAVPAPSRSPVPAWVPAALLGGAGAVAAEVVFTRKLALLYGATAPAAATVVAVYMAGMAIGAAIGGRLADRLGPRAGLAYVGAELLAAAWALAFLPLYGAVDAAAATLSPDTTLLATAVGTMLLVGPAAILSGATFPALTRLYGRVGDVRRMYAGNAIGAATGALCAGLWLPSSLGLSGTLALAAALSATAGLSILPRALGGAPPAELPAPSAGDAGTIPAALVYAVVGGAGMGAEIAWTRLLMQTGPNPGALCFPLVLAAYLLGLGVGGVWLEPRLRRLGELRALGTAAIVVGATTAVAVLLLPLIPEEPLMGHHVGGAPGNYAVFSLTGVQVSADRLAIYLLAAAIPGAASGAAFPIAASVLSRSRGGLGTGTGLAGAIGIAAAVVMSALMGFMPWPLPGTVRMLALTAFVSLAVGAWVRRSPVAAVAAVVSLGALLVPPHAGLQIPPNERVLAFVETAAGPSAVATFAPPGQETTDLRVPDTFVYTHGERVAGLRLGLDVPLLLHPDPSRTLLIAFGTGVNTVSMLRDPAVDHLTCVDVDPALPLLAPHVPTVGVDPFGTDRATFVHDDGRHLLRWTDERYDIIYNDVATYAQYVELGTVEFFALSRSKLAPGGMFALKIHADTITPEALRRFLATFLEVFPEAALFAEKTPNPVLVGFTAPPSLEVVRARMDATRGLWDESIDVADRVLLGPRGLRELAAGPLVTDDRPLPLRRTLIGPVGPTSHERTAWRTIAEAARRARASEEVFGVGRRPRIPRAAPAPPIPPRRGWF